MEMLMSAIITFCQFKNANIEIVQKESCMEQMVNCAVMKDSKTTPEQIKKCKQEYLKSKQLLFK